MANYNASVNLLIGGTSNLDKLVTRITQLEGLIERINATPIDLSKTAGRGAAADRLGVAQRRVQQLRDDYLELGEAQKRWQNGSRTGSAVGGNATTNQLRAQSDLLQSIASNSKLASAQFKEMTIAAALANAKANEAGRQRLSVLAEAFSGQGSRSQMSNVRGNASLQLVDRLVAAYPTITQSEAALNAYKQELGDIQQLLPIISNEYKVIENRIAQVNKVLADSGLRGQVSSISPQAGPASSLSSVAISEKRLKYQEKINDQLAKMAAIETRIEQAALSGTQKQQLRNNLDQAAEALGQHRLQDAIRITSEIDRQRMSLERLNRASQVKTATASPVDQEVANRQRLNHLINSSQLLEQGLLTAKARGLDVTEATQRVQGLINHLNRSDLTVDKQQLDLIDQILNGLRSELQLKKAIANTSIAEAKAARPGAMLGPGSPGGERAFRLAGEKQAAEQKAARAQKMESVALGVGFPLMFGAGPASLAGSLAGSFVGSGFGGQILGGALGQMIDDAVVSVRDLGNALSLAGDSYSALRETGLQFTAELESQVRAAKQLGDYTKAAQLQRTALIPTGDVGAFFGSQTSATEGVAGSVNRLDAAFKEIVKTASLLVGIIGVPFIELISVILKATNAILATVNAIITGLGGLFFKLTGLTDEVKNSNEEALKLTAEYQNQIAEQDKLIEQAIRLNKASAELNTLALGNVGLLGAEKQAADLTLRSKEKQAALEEEILKIKETARTGTAEQQAKATQLEAQARIKSNGEVFKDQIALYGSLYDQITADNINIARQKEDQEVSYRDMVRDTARLQADLNLDIARKAQDLRVQNIEKENELIKRQADLRISGLELESKKRLSSMAEFVPGIDTEEQQIKIGVTEAIDTLKIGLAKIEIESADRQRKLKTNLMRLDIENERYKYDMAVRINRLNVDNINKIAVINTQINRQNQDASRQTYKEGLESLRAQVDAAAIGNKFSLPEAKENVRLAKEQKINTTYYVESLNALETRAVELQNLITKLDALLKKTPAALPLVKQLPTVSGDTSAVGQESDRLRQLTVDSDRVSGQETQAQIAGLTQAQKAAVTQQVTNLAKPVQSLREANDKLLLSEKARLAIIQTGINPQLFEQQTLNTRTYETALKQLNVLKSDLKSRYKTGQMSEAFYTSSIAYIDRVITGLGVENAALQKNTLELEKQKNINATADFLAQGKGQIAGVEAGMRSGFIGQAQSTYADKITQGFTPEQATAMAAQTQALELATTKARALEGAYNDIGSATANLMTEGVAGLVAGTTTAQQVFADFLNNIGQALMKAAQQMIAQYLAIAAAQALANLFSPVKGAIGGGDAFGAAASSSTFSAGTSTAFGGMSIPGFAEGGRPPVGVPSLVGEKGPELFVPSAAGTIISAGPTAGIRDAMANGNNGNGATAPVLNMSFETTRFGNTDYVSREQLEAAMMQTRAEATKAGARRGMTMTLDKLQQSPSTRSRVGLG